MPDTETNDPSTLGAITVGSQVTRDIDGPGDEDWFAVMLEAGESYGFSVATGEDLLPDITGVFGQDGTPQTVLLNGFDSEPRFLSDGFSTSRYFTAPETGTYFVGVAAQESGATGSYDLHAFRDDVIGSNATTAVLIPGTLDTAEFVYSTMGAYEEDWFAVEVEAGGSYYFEASGNVPGETDGGTLDLIVLKLQTRDGITELLGRVAFDTGISSRALFVSDFYLPEGTGIIHVEVSGLDGATGTYKVRAIEGVPDTGETIDTALPVQLDQIVSAQVNDTNEDTHWFSLTAPTSGTFRFGIDSTEFHFFPLNPTLSLHDAAGEVIGTGSFVNDNIHEVFRKVEIVATLEADQEVFLNVTHLRTFTGFYNVLVTELVDLIGTAGDDWLMLQGARGVLSIDGGAGIDMMSFAGLDGGVLVNLSNGLIRHTDSSVPFQLVMTGIENATGTSFDDTLYGREGAEILRGLGGDDILIASEGADTIDGGGGRDTIDFRFATEGVQASLLRGTGWTGQAAGDRYSGIENIKGTLHDDFLWGDHRNNRLEGSHGDDTIIGNGGDDYILAGLGIDVIVYAGNRADYQIIQNGIRTDVISDGSEGHDIIGHAEVLRFADGDLIL